MIDGRIFRCSPSISTSISAPGSTKTTPHFRKTNSRRCAGGDWPGNVRELGARVKKYVATGDARALLDVEPSGHAPQDGKIRAGAPSRQATSERPADILPHERKFPSLKEATKRAVETTERALIEQALHHTLWNRRKAARLLDISYSSLLRRIEAYGIGKPKPE